jgi:hypothetical protein
MSLALLLLGLLLGLAQGQVMLQATPLAAGSATLNVSITNPSDYIYATPYILGIVTSAHALSCNVPVQFSYVTGPGLAGPEGTANLTLYTGASTILNGTGNAAVLLRVLWCSPPRAVVDGSVSSAYENVTEDVSVVYIRGGACPQVDPSTTSNFNPWPPLDSFISVAVGSRHGAGLRADGTLYFWGSNDYCQFGVGSPSASPSPNMVQYGTYTDLLPPLISKGTITCARRQPNPPLITWVCVGSPREPMDVDATVLDCATYLPAQFIFADLPNTTWLAVGDEMVALLDPVSGVFTAAGISEEIVTPLLQDDSPPSPYYPVVSCSDCHAANYVIFPGPGNGFVLLGTTAETIGHPGLRRSVGKPPPASVVLIGARGLCDEFGLGPPRIANVSYACEAFFAVDGATAYPNMAVGLTKGVVFSFSPFGYDPTSNLTLSPEFGTHAHAFFSAYYATDPETSALVFNHDVVGESPWTTAGYDADGNVVVCSFLVYLDYRETICDTTDLTSILATVTYTSLTAATNGRVTCIVEDSAGMVQCAGEYGTGVVPFYSTEGSMQPIPGIVSDIVVPMLYSSGVYSPDAQEAGVVAVAPDKALVVYGKAGCGSIYTISYVNGTLAAPPLLVTNTRTMITLEPWDGLKVCVDVYGCASRSWLVSPTTPPLPQPNATQFPTCVSAVAAGNHHTCILSCSGIPWCAGYTDGSPYAPVGHVDTRAFNMANTGPITVVGSIYAHADITCFVSASRTGVLCLGTFGPNVVSQPLLGNTLYLTGGGNWTIAEVVVGDRAACAVVVSGSLYKVACFGQNYQGMFGPSMVGLSWSYLQDGSGVMQFEAYPFVLLQGSCALILSGVYAFVGPLCTTPSGSGAGGTIVRQAAQAITFLASDAAMYANVSVGICSTLGCTLLPIAAIEHVFYGVGDIPIGGQGVDNDLYITAATTGGSSLRYRPGGTAETPLAPNLTLTMSDGRLCVGTWSTCYAFGGGVGGSVLGVATGRDHVVVLVGNSTAALVCCAGDNSMGQCGRLYTNVSVFDKFVCVSPDLFAWPYLPSAEEAAGEDDDAGGVAEGSGERPPMFTSMELALIIAGIVCALGILVLYFCMKYCRQRHVSYRKDVGLRYFRVPVQ